MSQDSERRSEFADGLRRGVGWAIGFGVVLGTGSALRGGGAETLKAGMKGFLRAREAAAELAERVQDIYAEAQAERAEESLGREREA
ncbi:MAG: DUF5132 domain-containing protein [Actinomycetota bacterium]|nr:DUF5132 domain-containing protein [Actinomycetota bacterium]